MCPPFRLLVLCLLLMLLASCAANAVPVEEVAPPEALVFTGERPGSLVLEYSVNGGNPARTSVSGAWAVPAYARAMPASLVEYRWLGPGDVELDSGSRVYAGQQTTVTWTAERGRYVIVFTGAGAHSVPGTRLDREYRRLVDLVGAGFAKIPPVVPVYIFPTEDEFARFTQAGRDAAGVAERTFKAAYVLSLYSTAVVERIAVHELAHLVGATGFGVTWVNEGLAHLAEEPYFTTEQGNYVRRLAARAEALAGEPDLGNLHGGAMYEAGYLLFRYMLDRYGVDTFRRFLVTAREQGVDQASRAVFGKEMRAFEREFGAALLARERGDWSLWNRAPSEA